MRACKKVKVNRAPQESIGGAHLPLPGLEPVGGEPLMSVTCGQCDARPTVTFPTARHHRPLAGTKLYSLVRGTCVSTTCQGLQLTAGRPGSNPRPIDRKSGALLLCHRATHGCMNVPKNLDDAGTPTTVTGAWLTLHNRLFSESPIKSTAENMLNFASFVVAAI